MKRFFTKARVGVAVVAVLLAAAAYDTRWGPPACDSAAWSFPIKPKMVFGLSIGFGPWAKAAFPVGSCVADLIAWMDRVGFGEVRRSTRESHVIDTDAKRASVIEREASGELINLRTLGQKAPIGRSYFSVAWNANDSGEISEITSDSEFFHFYLP